MSNNFPLNPAAAAAAVAAATNTTAALNPYSSYYGAMPSAGAPATVDPAYAAMYHQYMFAASAAANLTPASAGDLSKGPATSAAPTSSSTMNYAGHPIAYGYQYPNAVAHQPIIPAYHNSLMQNMYNENMMKSTQVRVAAPATGVRTPYSAAATASTHHHQGSNQAKKRKESKHFDTQYPISTEELFCDICKVYCFGPASYKEHLEGQKHKKKASNTIAAKSSEVPDPISSTGEDSASKETNVLVKSTNLNKRVTSISTVVLRCQLCNIMCVSTDSYRSHIRGAKHQRVSVIQSRMGKPIPSVMPEIISKNISKALETKVFEEFKDDVYNLEHNSSLKEIPIVFNNPTKSAPVVTELPEDSDCLYDVKPIGHDFIEEVLNESGKIVCFTCTLCECRFNDPNAKNLHLKGKRHRLQYKKKVDPSLIVEFIKKDHQRLENDRKSRLALKVNPECRIFSVDINPFEPSGRSLRQFSSIFNYSRSGSSNIVSQPIPPDLSKSFSDLLLEHKHSQIIPRKSELENIYQCAYIIEKSIRSVARLIDAHFTVNIEQPLAESVTKRLKSWPEIEENLSIEKLAQPTAKPVELIRVVRVGQLGKGYLLSGEHTMSMVLLSSIFPTTGLMKIFTSLLPDTIKEMNNDYSATVEENESESSFFLAVENHLGHLKFQILLTSPFLRTAAQTELDEYPDLLDKHKCLQALAEVRHFRWYKERTLHYHHYNFLVRILRDLCRRVPTWSKLTLWTIELVLERICVSAGIFLPPSALMRHFFEFFSHGICMARGTGLGDPCEENFPNIFTYLSMQDMEDVMSSAQHTLRLIAMRQLNKVLGVDAYEVYRKRLNEKQLTSGLSAKDDTEQMANHPIDPLVDPQSSTGTVEALLKRKCSTDSGGEPNKTIKLS